MSKKPSQQARQPVSRVTRNQPSAPRAAGKGPIKPVGSAPQGQGHGSQGHPHEKRRADEKHRFDEPRFNKDERKPGAKPFGKPGEQRFKSEGDNRQPGSGSKPYGKPAGDRFNKPAGEGRFGDERQPGTGSKPYGKPTGDRFKSSDDRRGPSKGDQFKQVGSQGRVDDERRFGDDRKPAGKPFVKPVGESRYGDDRKPAGKPYGKPAGEGRFGDDRKPAGKPYGKPAGEERKPGGKPYTPSGDRFRTEGNEQGAKNFGEARTYNKSSKPAAPVTRAKKLQVRDPNQKIQTRTKELRQTRVDIDTVEPIRLQKALAASGAGSRREMEEAIEAGQVMVNGKRASLGDKVGPRDKVILQGHPIKLKWADRLPRIIIYHKQEGEIVSRDDPGGRVTVFSRLPQAKSSRWVAVGRLDVNTSGLLIVTTSGELVNRMAHPSFEAEREYAVRVLGELTDEQKKAITSEVLLDDGPARFDRLMDQGGEGANHWYRVVIREGRNREVRRMFEAYGLTVSRLIRLRFGPIGLPARLKRGQFYELNELEVANVMKWAGLTVTGMVKPPKD